MQSSKFLLALTLSTALAGGVAVPAAHADRAPGNAQVTEVARRASAAARTADADADRYAEREARAQDQARFQGGEGAGGVAIYLSTAAAIVLGVLLLVVVL